MNDNAQLTLPDAPTPAILDALGIMNFQSGPIAHCFRAAGQDIPPKCEFEQAHVLFWALRLAITHGETWRAVAAEEIRAMKALVEANKAKEATRAELIEYFVSDVNGKGLRPEFVNECPNERLRRMAELAGDGFTAWLAAKRLKATA